MIETVTDDEEICECPICGEFEGARSSVEGHISSVTDEDHKGLTGRDLREDIEGTATVVDDDDVAADGGGESTEGDYHEGVTVEPDRSEDEEEDPATDGLDVTEEDDPDVADLEDGPTSIGIPKNAVYAVVGIAILWFLFSGNGSSSTAPIEDVDDQEETNEPVADEAVAGGLQ